MVKAEIAFVGSVVLIVWHPEHLQSNCSEVL